MSKPTNADQLPHIISDAYIVRLIELAQAGVISTATFRAIMNGEEPDEEQQQ